MNNTKLSRVITEELLKILKERFETNFQRHPDLLWDDVQKKLIERPENLWSLNEMEISDGEPDVIGYDETTNEYLFCDCAAESPKDRRSLCYDN